MEQSKVGAEKVRRRLVYCLYPNSHVVVENLFFSLGALLCEKEKVSTTTWLFGVPVVDYSSRGCKLSHTQKPCRSWNAQSTAGKHVVKLGCTFRFTDMDFC